MTAKTVNDEMLGNLARRQTDLFSRVAKGAVPFYTTMNGLQLLIEGREVGPINKIQDWLQEIVERERKYHSDFFGQGFDLAEFEKTLKKYGRQKIRRWQKLGLEPHFLPDVVMGRNDKFPGWTVKPEEWYFNKADEGKILRNSNGELIIDKTPFGLGGITVLIDTRLKPKYNGGRQMYQDDSPLGPVLEKLRKDRRIGVYEYGPPSSRFGVSSDEWENAIKPALAEKLGLKVNQVRLERTIEANVIPQLFYPDMPRKDDGATNTWVWYEEYFGGRDSRLSGGYSGLGGLAFVDCRSADGRWDDRSFRPLAVL